ncbi:MAG: ABC transporter permease [Xanthomonadales bacterium]|nr:ABC transporter permease [Xanthomonadales bacterium]
MTSLLRLRGLSTRRHFASHRGQLWLAVLGVAIGVAAVVAVDLARISVRASFQASLDAAVGGATHRIVGGEAGIPQSRYVELRRKLGWIPMAPTVDAQVVGPDGLPWTLLGVDLLREEAVARSGGRWRGIDGFPIDRWFAGDDLVLAPEGLPLPPEPTLTIDGRAFPVEIAAAYPVSGPPARVLLADIGTAQRWLGREGHLDSVLVVADELAEDALNRTLGGDLRLVRENTESAGLSRAFELNLMALSLLTALVGIFIVYNTFSFLVLQRKPVYALEFALGASPGARTRGVLLEALALGVLGTGIGIVLGLVLGQVTLSLVSQTVSDLYYDPGDAQVILAPLTAIKALLVGLAGCLVAGWAASRSVSSASQRISQRVGIIASLALVAGLFLLVVPGPLLTGLAGVFATSLGYALLGGPFLALLSEPLIRRIPVAAFPFVGLGARRVPRSLDRTLPAVAALTLAVATVCGVGLMIESFRTSVSDWLDQSLSADYYLAADDGVVSRADIDRLRALPEVEGMSRFNLRTAYVGDTAIDLAVQDLTDEGWNSYQLLDGDSSVWARFDREPVGLVTESLARLENLGLGERIAVKIDDRSLELTIAGVIRDYRTGPGRVLMSWKQYSALAGAPEPTSIGLYLAPQADGEAVERVAATLLAERSDYRFASTGEIRARSLEIFDETFRLTRVMQWIAAVVALVGLTGALLALQLERRRELVLLEALGLTAAEQRRCVRIEAFLLGGVIAVFAMPLGILLAWSLTAVINPRAFGWRLELIWAPFPVVLALGIAVFGAWIAGLAASSQVGEAAS